MLQKIADFVQHNSWSTAPDLDEFPDSPLEGNRDITLTPKEQEVLQYFAQGKTYKDIAELLSIHYLTARNYVLGIKKKLHIKNNIDLIKYAIKHGYTSVSSQTD